MASQRARILDALADVVAAHGWRRTTIAAVSTHASVSPATFTDIFSGLDAAFVSLVRQVTTQAVSLLRDAFEHELIWQLGVIGAVESLMRFFDAEPSLARIWLVEANAGPSEALEQRVKLLGPFLTLIDEGRNVVPGRREPPPFASEALVASMIGILHTRLVTGKTPPFVSLLGELTALLVAPFLDHVEAEQVVQQAEDRYRANMGKPAAAPVSRTANVPKQLAILVPCCFLR